MSLPRCVTVAVLVLSAASAFADDARNQCPVGTWQPRVTEARAAGPTVLIFNEAGRFAALVAHRTGSLHSASGTWTLQDNGGEVVLAFDEPPAKYLLGTSRYLQMLLLGDELHPYPGTSYRSPLAATSWRRVDAPIVDASAGNGK